MHILIFTGGTVRQGRTVKKITKQTVDGIIAADSGAKEALMLGIIPHTVIGDYDSLDKKTLETLKKSNARLLTYPREKNETDTELALQHAIAIGATDITIVGGIEGNRLDHVLANIFLLMQQKKTEICFVNGNQKTWLVSGPATEIIEGKSGDLLSLIPLSEDILHTVSEGLQYPLNNETLFFGKSRGISNVLTKASARVSFEKGSLLFVQTEKE